MSSFEKRLQSEVDSLKEERDRRMLEHQEALQKERESFKGKIHNVEAKCREAESKRTTLMFDLEKEKAGWGLKQDHM